MPCPVPTNPGTRIQLPLTPLHVLLTSPSYKLKPHFTCPGTKKGTCSRTKIIYIQKAREAASPRATRNGAHTHLTPSPDPPATLPPGRLPSGPAPPLRSPPTPATPPPHQPPPPTTTPGPPHCIANALPATSPIAPSSAATPEAELQTPASTRPEST
ncbi:hypothetical protein E4T56_gene18764 [Termitomyces sp. T112]|nr:hypothetical protein E4T56_gene18764 [Termitomyces sp. T112]